MKRFGILCLAMVLVGMFCGAALAGDTLADVKKKGVLVAGVKDSLPPFGYVDESTRTIIGYDIDFCKAIADKLGVKLELKPVTSASRMPQLVEGNIDIIAATMTKTPERAQQIDFSVTYFATGQKFLVKKGTVKVLKDLEGKKIGTAKGSTSEQNAAKAAADRYHPVLRRLSPGFPGVAAGQGVCRNHRRIDSRRDARQSPQQGRI